MRVIGRTLLAGGSVGVPRCALLALVATAAGLAAPPVLAKPKSGDVVGVMRDNPGPPAATPVSMVKRTDLQFGRLVMTTTTGGSVVVPSYGLPRYVNFVSIGSAPTPARFEVQGPANKQVQLQLIFPLSGTYGAEGNAKLDGLSVSADYTPGFRQDGTLVTLRLDGSGNNAISVGGKLTLSSGLPGKTSILIPITASVVE